MDNIAQTLLKKKELVKKKLNGDQLDNEYKKWENRIWDN